jgi:hypothetical protein
MVTTEGVAHVEEDEETVTLEPLQRLPSTKVCAPPSVTMSLTMARRAQQTRCERLGRRSFTMSEQFMDTISVMNFKIGKQYLLLNLHIPSKCLTSTR